MAEQLICNQQVVGSTPITSSKKPTRRGRLIMGDFPSGQRGQTVNLLSLTSVVRIHHPPPNKRPSPKGLVFYLVEKVGERNTETRTQENKKTNRIISVLESDKERSDAREGHESTIPHQKKALALQVLFSTKFAFGE